MRVAILGCGYVGLALGRRLRQDGHYVVGVRRSKTGLERVDDAGLDAVGADVTDPTTLSKIPDVGVIVFAASAGGRDATSARETYVEGLETVITHFESRTDRPERLVYTSSTGVYGDHDGDWVDESTPPADGTERVRVLASAEEFVLEETEGIDGTVVRFGGLYGPDRYRIDRYLAGPVTDGWLNLVHRTDAAGAVEHLLSEDAARGGVVNAVDGNPVRKSDLAAWLADQCGVSRPRVRSVEERIEAENPPASKRQRLRADKRVSNRKLRDLGYEFEYPTYRDGYREGIAQYCGDSG